MVQLNAYHLALNIEIRTKREVSFLRKRLGSFLAKVVGIIHVKIVQYDQ